MDKRATKILLACVLCTIMVIVLFLITIRFTRMSCELIQIDPAQLRSAQLDDFHKATPTRSHDKSLLMKISAYLEYNVQPASGNSAPGDRPHAGWPATGPLAQAVEAPATLASSANHNNLASAQSSQPQQQQMNPGPVLPSGQQQAPLNGPAARPAPTPSTPQTGTTSTQHHQNSSFLQAPAPSQQQQPPPPPMDRVAPLAVGRAEKRFLPMDLESIETNKLADGARFKYTLTFNCSKLVLVLAKQPSSAHVESMSLELEPTSRGKSTCEMLVPGQANLFAAQLQDGILHYSCKNLVSFKCYHKGSPSESLLAELHINAIQFETVTNSTAELKRNSFRAKNPRECASEPQASSGPTNPSVQ